MMEVLARSMCARGRLLVRQLASGPEGLPIEIYCFTNDTDWSVYEGIQSDLFDHIMIVRYQEQRSRIAL